MENLEYKYHRNTSNLKFSTIEIEILNYIKKGYTSVKIAKLRDCSSRTIEKHRSNIIQKLGIPSHQNALILWLHKNPNFLANSIGFFVKKTC